MLGIFFTHRPMGSAIWNHFQITACMHPIWMKFGGPSGKHIPHSLVKFPFRRTAHLWAVCVSIGLSTQMSIGCELGEAGWPSQECFRADDFFQCNPGSTGPGACGNTLSHQADHPSLIYLTLNCALPPRNENPDISGLASLGRLSFWQCIRNTPKLGPSHFHDHWLQCQNPIPALGSAIWSDSE